VVALALNALLPELVPCCVGLLLRVVVAHH
jgi:hypothetical protein